MNFSCQSFIASVRKDFPAEFILKLSFDDIIVQVNVSHPKLFEVLCDYFSEFLLTRQDERQPLIHISAHEAQPPNLPLSFSVKKPDYRKSKIKEEFVKAGFKDKEAFSVMRLFLEKGV